VGLKIGSQDIRDLAIGGMVAAEYKSVAKPVSRLLDASALEVKHLAHSTLQLKVEVGSAILIYGWMLELGILIEMLALTSGVIAGFFVKRPPQHDSDL
jgi:hypothetical protein